MVKVLLLQQWYQASDPAMEEALWERLSFRHFVGLGLQDDAPGSLHDQPLPHAGDDGRGWPRGCSPPWRTSWGRDGVLVQQGTLVDATLVEAQVRRPKGGATGAGSPTEPGRDLGPPGAARPVRLQAAPGRGRRLRGGPPRGADAGQRDTRLGWRTS